MRLTALALLLMLPSMAAAKPIDVKFQILPPGELGQMPQVGQVRYYLLPDFLKLAQFDAELVQLRRDTAALQKIVEGLKKELTDKDIIISTLQSDKELLTNRDNRLSKDLNDCHDALQKCQSPSIWPWVVGGLGGAALLVVGGVLVGVYVHH